MGLLSLNKFSPKYSYALGCFLWVYNQIKVLHSPLLCYVYECYFSLHNQSWISPWIKLISNELDITAHIHASQLLCPIMHFAITFDVLIRMYTEQMRTRPNVWSASPWLSFIGSLCYVSNKIMYVLSTVILVFISWAASQIRNKHQNKTRFSAQTVPHSSVYIVLYIFKHL